MCLPSAWETMTAKERLAGAEAVREHHRALTDAYVSEMDRGVRCGPAQRAFDAHTKEHADFVARRKAAQQK